jgi:hypothetical protein
MSTIEEQINLLNLEKQENLIAIDELNIKKQSLEQTILDANSLIVNSNVDIANFDNLIANLENNNLIIDDIITTIEG